MIKNVQLNPEIGQIKLGKVGVEYGSHAVARSSEKLFQLPESVVIDRNIVEMEVSPAGKATKIVVRAPYDNKADIVLVLIPTDKINQGVLFCKTAWLNKKDDNHSTLCKKRLSA